MASGTQSRLRSRSARGRGRAPRSCTRDSLLRKNVGTRCRLWGRDAGAPAPPMQHTKQLHEPPQGPAAKTRTPALGWTMHRQGPASGRIIRRDVALGSQSDQGEQMPP